MRKTAAPLGLALRQRSGVSAIGIVGGLLVLLMVAAVACEDPEPELAGEPTVSSPGPTTTATHASPTPTLPPTNTPTVTPVRAPRGRADALLCGYPISRANVHTHSNAVAGSNPNVHTHVNAVRRLSRMRESWASRLLQTIPWLGNPPGCSSPAGCDIHHRPVDSRCGARRQPRGDGVGYRRNDRGRS